MHTRIRVAQTGPDETFIGTYPHVISTPITCVDVHHMPAVLPIQAYP